MGQHKLLLPWGETTLIQHVLAAWHTSPVKHIVVVVRPDDQDLTSVCRDLSVDVVIPAVPPPEMKDSVQHALRHIQRHYHPGPQDAWLLAPADMPRLSRTVIHRLLDGHQPSDPAILVPSLQGRRGHPVLFPWPLAQRVHHLSAGEGVNALLGRFALREIECPGEPMSEDVDTPADYRRLGGPSDGS